MTLPLPSGWVDTGITRSFTCTASVRVNSVWLWQAGVDFTGFGTKATICTWSIEPCYLSFGTDALVTGYAINGPGATTGLTTLGGIHILPNHDSATPWTGYVAETNSYTVTGGTIGSGGNTSQWYDFKRVQGPYRLGVSYQAIPRDSAPTPAHAQLDYEVIYAWFSDPNTNWNETFGPCSYSFLPSPTSVNGPFQSVTGYGISVGLIGYYPVNLGGGGGVAAEWKNLQYDQYVEGVMVDVDTSAVNQKFIKGTTAFWGSWTGDPALEPTPSEFDGINWQHGYECTYYLDVRQCGDSELVCPIYDSFVTSDPSTIPYQNQLATGTYHFQIPNYSWTAAQYKFPTNPISFTLDSVYLSNLTPKICSNNFYDNLGQPIDPTKPVYESSYDTAIPIKVAPPNYNPLNNPRPIGGSLNGDGVMLLTGSCTEGDLVGSLTGSITAGINVDKDGVITGSLSVSAAGTITGAVNGSVGFNASGDIVNGNVIFSTCGGELALNTPNSIKNTAITAVGDFEAFISGAVQGDIPLTANLTVTLGDDLSLDSAAVSLTSNSNSVITDGVGSISGSGNGLFTATNTQLPAPEYHSFDIEANITCGGNRNSQHWYTPIPMFIPAQLDILNPDGNRPSDWISDDLSKGRVTGLDQFSVNATGAKFHRTLITNWQNYLDKGDCASHMGANFAIDGYKWTKHNRQDYTPGFTQIIYPEDIWWYGTYSYILLAVNVPSDGTLTLTLNYTVLTVNDTHQEPFRCDDLEFDFGGGSANYTFNVKQGDNSVYIDLLFPDGGGPVDLGRIGSWQLWGFNTGNYHLTGMHLAIHPDVKTMSLPYHKGYFKVGFGSPRSRVSGGAKSVDYSVPTLSVDGNQAFGNIADQANKNDEIGATGGGTRYVDPLEDITLPEPFNIEDSQKSLTQFANEIQDIEGINFIWSQLLFDAGCRDSEGNRLSGEISQWLWDILPYAQLHLKGSNYVLDPKCSPVCRSVTIAAGIPHKIVCDWSIYGSMETVLSDGIKRKSNVNVEVVDRGGNQIASATTDDQGFAIVHPIPANGDEFYGIREVGNTVIPTAGVQLRPRDNVREVVFVPGTGGGGSTKICNRICMTIRGDTGAGRRFYSDGSTITQVSYYSGTAIPINSVRESSDGIITNGSAPAAIKDKRGIYHLWYTRGGNLYYRYDVANKWSNEQLTLSNYSCPGVCYSPEMHSAYMAATNSGRCKFILWNLKKCTDINLDWVTESIVDIGASDNVCPAIEMMQNGVLQIWWSFQSNIQTMVSYNLGKTWSNA